MGDACGEQVIVDFAAYAEAACPIGGGASEQAGQS